MGNYQAKKLAAQQYNDAIDYRKWLINNTVGQERQRPARSFCRAGYSDLLAALAHSMRSNVK